MPHLEIDHNLCRSHLRQALVTLADSEGLGAVVADELIKALRDDTPKRPSSPEMAGLHRTFQAMHTEAKEWIESYIDGLLKVRDPDVLKKASDYKTGPLTAADLREITEAIKAKYGHIAAQFQSQEVATTAAELQQWKALGIVGKDVTLTNFGELAVSGQKVVRNAFLTGRLHNALQTGKTYQEVLDAALSAPLLRPDRFAVAAAEHSAGAYVAAFGSGVASKAVELAVSKNRAMIRNMTVDYFNRKLPATARHPTPHPQSVDSWQGFASELRTKMDDKDLDWDRVAFYELHDAQSAGRAHEVLSSHGPAQLVYKRPRPTACPQCVYLYTKPDGKPRLFKLGDMLVHGNNIGRKPMPVRKGEVVGAERDDGAETLQPVVGQVHPWCECDGPNLYTGMELWA